jgi:hypothetical protein
MSRLDAPGPWHLPNPTVLTPGPAIKPKPRP